MPATSTPSPVRLKEAGFYSAGELLAGLVPFGRTELYRRVGAGTFPQPAKFGRRSAWPAPAVNAWLSAHGGIAAEKCGA